MPGAAGVQTNKSARAMRAVRDSPKTEELGACMTPTPSRSGAKALDTESAPSRASALAPVPSSGTGAQTERLSAGGVIRFHDQWGSSSQYFARKQLRSAWCASYHARTNTSVAETTRII